MCGLLLYLANKNDRVSGTCILRVALFNVTFYEEESHLSIIHPVDSDVC